MLLSSQRKSENLSKEQTILLPPRSLFPLMANVNKSTRRHVVRSAVKSKMGGAWWVLLRSPFPAPKHHLQSGGFVPVTVEDKAFWSTLIKYQTEPPIQISGWFALIRTFVWRLCDFTVRDNPWLMLTITARSYNWCINNECGHHWWDISTVCHTDEGK